MARQPNILLVDDDRSVREALGEALETEEYSVARAASGSEALRQFQDPRAQQVDLVILDLHLKHENGWNVFLHLTTIAPQVPVIMMTCARGQKLPPRTPTSAALLEKPVDVRLLLDTLKNLTSRSATAPTPAPLVPESL